MPVQISELVSHPVAEVVRTIRRGIPARSFSEVAGKVGISKQELATKLGLAQRTITRKEGAGARLTSEESEKVMRVVRVQQLARKLFTDDDAAAEWLRTPAPALNGAAPIDLLDTDLGTREVESLILGIAHGNVI
jgi:putative toxin-antitoxin system antitoxin component (TIGR02293 family)